MSIGSWRVPSATRKTGMDFSQKRAYETRGSLDGEELGLAFSTPSPFPAFDDPGESQETGGGGDDWESDVRLFVGEWLGDEAGGAGETGGESPRRDAAAASPSASSPAGRGAGRMGGQGPEDEGRPLVVGEEQRVQLIPQGAPLVDIAADMRSAGEGGDEEEEEEEEGEGGGGSRGSRGKGRSRASRSERKAVWWQAGAAHERLFSAALRLELEEEQRLLKQRLEVWDNNRLAQEGLAVFALKAEKYDTLYRDVVVRFTPKATPTLPNHALGPGDIVFISRRSPLDGAIEGLVVERALRWLNVAVRESAAGPLGGGKTAWRLDKGANTVAFERMMAALAYMSTPLRATTGAGDDPGANEGRAFLQRAVLSGAVGETAVEELASRSPRWATGGKAQERMKKVKKGLRDLAMLNESQHRAVVAAMGRTVTLWQGPPGTGKTRTLLAFVSVAAGLPGEGQILACADSNVAVDNLLEGLVGAGIRVVRLGQPAKVAEGLREATLDALAARHPRGVRAAKLRAQAESMSGTEKRAAFDEVRAEEAAAMQAVLDGAQVVCSTNVGAGDPILLERQFRICVIDEATQATEPSCMVPLSRGIESVVLVGDPQQLPPTVVSQEALASGLAVSLFERLQRGGLEPLLLDTQYRMHPEIADFPSSAFYRGRLKSFPRPEDRQAPSGFPWPDPSTPVAFVDVPEGRDMAAESGTSLCNEVEARLAVAVAGNILFAGGVEQPKDIGIVTPYAAQVQMVGDFLAAVGGPGSSSAALSVKSVDGFQGKEKEVIIFSTVRSNRARNVGFLRDPRRLNVAITRPRRGLIVVGSSDTLTADPVWREWVKWASRRGLILTSEEVLASLGPSALRPEALVRARGPGPRAGSSSSPPPY